jgi:hypothetical protein
VREAAELGLRIPRVRGDLPQPVGRAGSRARQRYEQGRLPRPLALWLQSLLEIEEAPSSGQLRRMVISADITTPDPSG